MTVTRFRRVLTIQFRTNRVTFNVELASQPGRGTLRMVILSHSTSTRFDFCGSTLVHRVLYVRAA